jgi:hypothetical protein
MLVEFERLSACSLVAQRLLGSMRRIFFDIMGHHLDLYCAERRQLCEEALQPLTRPLPSSRTSLGDLPPPAGTIGQVSFWLYTGGSILHFPVRK